MEQNEAQRRSTDFSVPVLPYATAVAMDGAQEFIFEVR
jgi:hypothetical protein